MGEDWREALFARRTMGVRPGLDAIRAADSELGQPGEGRPTVHIVGTNGKGSTAAMLEHALRGAGRRTGLYTSPHLHRVGERIRIDGQPVADSVVQAAADAVLSSESRAGRALSFFEVLTLAALWVFEREAVDVLVLEAGLGGRLDATRVRTSAVTLITRIGMDHQAYLGDTLSAIAAEKGAVMHRGAPAWTEAQDPAAADVLRAQAARVGTRLTQVEPLSRAPRGLPGLHQRHNGALALAGARFFAPETPVAALDGVRWPGRIERVTLNDGEVIFDVAHNLEGVEALADHLEAEGLTVDTLVFGCMADKPGAAMLTRLRGLGAGEMWWVDPRDEGSHAAPDGVDRRFDARDRAVEAQLRDRTRGTERVLICGSHFLVARLREALLEVEQPDAPELTDPVARSS